MIKTVGSKEQMSVCKVNYMVISFEMKLLLFDTVLYALAQ